jgi:DNA-binding NarL/FixJ family response regulator
LIRAVVVAASPVIEAGLRSLLEQETGIEVVDSEAAADVAVMDGDASAIEMEGAPVVLLSDDADAARQSEAWPSRLRAVLHRSVGGGELAAAVQAVAAGFVLLRVEEAERMMLPPRASPAGAGESLTPREMEVLQMIAAGESNKRIAWRLSISEHTVKFHVASILSKLGASSRAEAVATGIRRGLIFL